jgi:hypothetical protein
MIGSIVDLKQFVDLESEAEVSIARELNWEAKLALIDLMIAKNIGNRQLGSLGYLLEFREGVIQEKFKLPDDYLSRKAEIVAVCEAEEKKERRRGTPDALADADRWFFEKSNRLFCLQNEVLRGVYPIRLVFTGVEAM